MNEEIMRSKGIEHILDVCAEGIEAVIDNKPKTGCSCCLFVLAGIVAGAAYVCNAYLPKPQPVESVAPVQSVDYGRPERE